MLPYAAQWIDESDVSAVVDVLRSEWLTTGPAVDRLEQEFAEFVGAAEAVAVSSGTAALHVGINALGIHDEDEVIIPAMTFVATANSVVFEGGTPVFADVLPGTLLLDPGDVEAKITARTRAIMAVDYAGHPCEYDILKCIADRKGLALVGDACHSAGAKYNGRSVGTLASLSAFSFHPAKHITSGEGGIVTTDDHDLATKMKIFRNHGITSDHHQRRQKGSWVYDMVNLGFNYRLTDIQSTLASSQLGNLPRWLLRRREIAQIYDAAFADIPYLQPLKVEKNVSHAYHLYVIRINFEKVGMDKITFFSALRAEGIGVNVHYKPVHLQPFYRNRFRTKIGQCPIAEKAYEEIISLPIFPRMTNKDAMDVINAVYKIVEAEYK